jgi:mRNA interferase MazF
MTALDRGDVVLVGFVFSDESGAKLRPAAIISSAAYHRSRGEAVILAITSNVRRRLVGDHAIAEWPQAGLLFPSVATGILRTVKRTMVVRKLGALAPRDLTAIEGQIRRALAL